MIDIVCLGEVLVDLVPTDTGLDLATADTFIKAAGGAPANVAVGCARLGVATSFLGMVGADGFGRYLASTLASRGVELTALRTTPLAPTALAAVSLAADGDRDFLFYGNPAAHMLFSPADLDTALIRNARILHIGSISLIGGPLREATLEAVALASRQHVLVSYDPNLRLSLWPNATAAADGLRLGLSHANIVKISEDEVAFLAEGCDLIESARALWHDGLHIMVVTRGRRGAIWLTAATEGKVPGFVVDAIDATGAGDAFTAAFLTRLVDYPDLMTEAAALDAALRFANAAGALATTKRGAIPALCDRRTVDAFLAERATSRRP